MLYFSIPAESDLSGMIQPCGALLVLSLDLAQVLQASDNLVEMIGISAEEALERGPGHALGNDLWRHLTLELQGRARLPAAAVMSRRVAGRVRRLQVAVHRQGERVLVEIEPLQTSSNKRRLLAGSRCSRQPNIPTDCWKRWSRGCNRSPGTTACWSPASMPMDKINDQHGHEMGDRVLTELAAAVEGKLRGSDFLGRWGGEEFVVMASHCGLESGLGLAERLRAYVATLSVPGLSRRITISIGVATWQPGDTRKSLLARADAAMYRAKHGGRNRVEY